MVVSYISYQGGTGLSKADATCYLGWLDAGNRGRHYDEQRVRGAEPPAPLEVPPPPPKEGVKKKAAGAEPDSYVCSLLMIGGKQRTVCGLVSVGDFLAMTGESRDYVSAGAGNPETLAFLLGQERGKLFYQPDERVYEFVELPASHIRHTSAKAKRVALARERRDQEERRLRWTREREAAKDEAASARIERIAAKLYEFDRHNMPWEDAEARTRDLYRDRAVEVIALY